ncbi:MAG: hypothetical protein L6U16_06425 [Porphyromonadaceae bacterium]|nr:MAG: hypothetical protein L6U16_06425 [Porphyromonadaceae bacterium]
MRKNVNPQAGIAVIDINDVPELYSGIKYFDGDIAFADKISTIPNLTDVFKVTFVAVVFCLRGNLRIKLNNVEHIVNEREALYIGANTVVSDVEHEDDFDCKIVVVANTMSMNFINKSIVEAVMLIGSNPVVKFTQHESELMLKYYELAMFKIEHPQINYSRETLMGILKSFCPRPAFVREQALHRER